MYILYTWIFVNIRLKHTIKCLRVRKTYGRQKWRVSIAYTREINTKLEEWNNASKKLDFV